MEMDNYIYLLMQDHLNAVGEITEMIYVASELEKYAYLGAVAVITEELYFARKEQ